MYFWLFWTGCTPVETPTAAHSDPVETATGHLEAQVEKLAEIGAVRWLTTLEDELGMTHVRFAQTIDGVEVVGAQVIVHLDADGSVVSTTDAAVHGITPQNTVEYSPEEALDGAVDAAGGWQHVTNTPSAALRLMRWEGVDRFVYEVRLERLDFSMQTSIPVLFLDAQTLDVVRRYDDLQTATGTANTAYNGAIDFPVSDSPPHRLVGDRVGTYSFSNTQPAWNAYNDSDLTDITSPTLAFSVPDAGPDAHFGIDRTDVYFQTVHGRNGIDGSGGPAPFADGVMAAGVNYGFQYNNAFWNGYAMAFGDGDGSVLGSLATLDIAAHELTHGVTDFTADLVYQNESGAMNESMSDVFAVLVEAWVRGESPEIWDIGEETYTPGTPGDALRYMDDPTLDGISTEHYSTRYTGSADNGGVHINSGIGNLAFYLASEGGSHPNPVHRLQPVDGIGLERAGAIWYRALSVYMTPQTGFSGARAATVTAARDLYGPGSYEEDAIRNAWSEVGVGAPDQGALELAATGLSGGSNSWQYFTVDVPPGTTELRVQTHSGTGDADLYTRQGANPSAFNFACRSWNIGNSETCLHPSPTSGAWHIGINGYTPYSGLVVEVFIIGGCDGGTSEVPGNGYDEDCDGLDAACGTDSTGSCSPSLSITEVMLDPVNSTNGQWVEVQNHSAHDVDLRGATLMFDAGATTLDRHTVVPAGGYAVLGSSADPEENGGVFVDEAFATSLDTSGDTIILRSAGGTELDRVELTTAFSSGIALPSGASLAVDPDFDTADTNDVATRWCDGRTSFGDGDFGTPGWANDECDWTIPMDFAYDVDGNGVYDDVTGTTTLSFGFDDTERFFNTGNGGSGWVTRTTDGSGQHLELEYDGTGVTYEASRSFGTDCFSGGSMTGLPATVSAGQWSVSTCP